VTASADAFVHIRELYLAGLYSLVEGDHAQFDLHRASTAPMRLAQNQIDTSNYRTTRAARWPKARASSIESEPKESAALSLVRQAGGQHNLRPVYP
jgi:hypothetical protein